jgi:pimeloyl-ACP methyl ester carboxylesterase
MPETISHTSADGTSISTVSIGQGPALVMVPGSLQYARSMMGLAEHLAKWRTVYVVNRRGREGSGPQGDDYSYAKEAQDVIAVMTAVRASELFGFSSGGLLALETALVHPVAKLAVYEPPVSVAEPRTDPWYPDYEQAVRDGRNNLALAIVLRGLESLGSAGRKSLPFARFVVSALTWTQEGRDMVALVPTFGAEYREVERLAYRPDRYREITADTLLMAGAKGDDEYRQGARFLESVIPRSRFVEMPGIGHDAVQGGPARKVAAELKDFFCDG